MSSAGSGTKSPASYQRRIQRSQAEIQIQKELDGLQNELKRFKEVLQSVEEVGEIEI